MDTIFKIQWLKTKKYIWYSYFFKQIWQLHLSTHYCFGTLYLMKLFVVECLVRVVVIKDLSILLISIPNFVILPFLGTVYSAYLKNFSISPHETYSRNETNSLVDDLIRYRWSKQPLGSLNCRKRLRPIVFQFLLIRWLYVFYAFSVHWFVW